MKGVEKKKKPKKKATIISNIKLSHNLDVIPKLFKNGSVKKLDSSKESKSLVGKENTVSDDDIIASSQKHTESNLKKKIQKGILEKSNFHKKTINVSNENNDVIGDVIIEEINEMGESSQIDSISMLTSEHKNMNSTELANFEEISNIDDSFDDTGTPVNSFKMLNSADPENINQDTVTSNVLETSTETKKKKNSKKIQAKLNLGSSKLSYSVMKKEHLKSKKKSENELLVDKKDYESYNECDQNLSKKLMEKLASLKIILQHEVPPQHTVEKQAGTRSLTLKEINAFEIYGPLKKGSFTQKEDNIIKKNWQDFCNIHDWNSKIVKPFLNMKHDGKFYISQIESRKNFVKFLANGLPWRSLYSVYFRFRNLYSTSFKQGKYTKKEDDIIIEFMKKTDHSEKKCAELAKLLHRKRNSIWERIKCLKNNNQFTESETNDDDLKIEKEKKKRQTCLGPDENEENQVKKNIYSDDNISEHDDIFSENEDPKNFNDSEENFSLKKDNQVQWNFDLVSNYILALIKLTSAKNILDLKNKTIDSHVWKKLEKEINIEKRCLKNFWYLQLHMQLFSPEAISLNDIKIKLISDLYENYTSCANINWQDISLKFDGTNSIFLSHLFDNLLEHAQSKIDSSEPCDLLKYLYKNHVPELKNKPVDAILPKLFYKYNKIICLDKGAEDKIIYKRSHDPFSDDEY